MSITPGAGGVFQVESRNPAGGVTSGLDLALWLIERFASAPAAGAVQREMEYQRRGVVWRQPSQ